MIVFILRGEALGCPRMKRRAFAPIRGVTLIQNLLFSSLKIGEIFERVCENYIFPPPHTKSFGLLS
jgi:hypothetical protein